MELNIFNTDTTLVPRHLNINEWAAEDRPTYKLANNGPSALTTNELLAIVLNKGTRTANAIELSRSVLASVDNDLSKLSRCSIHDLMKIAGIGYYKAAQILACIEIGNRRQLQQAERNNDCGSATAIYNMMHPILCDQEYEQAWILLLNQNYKLIKRQLISTGGISETAVDVRVIMKHAIMAGATIIALIHNHPSGNNRPSTEDDRLTTRMKNACELLRIYFLDHVIIATDKYYSYREEGRL